MQLEIGAYDPYDIDKPHMLQQKMLELDLRGPKINFAHIVAGRGSGKSLGIVLLLLNICFKDKLVVLYLSPTYKMIMDNFMPLWTDIVPSDIYKYNASEKKLTLCNGSQIWLRSRSIEAPAKGAENLRGINANIILDDEAALGFSRSQFTTALACLRRPGKYRAYITISTPKLNDYADLVNSPGHKKFIFPSASNPHLPDCFIDVARAEMSALEFEREFNASFVNLSGRIWNTFKDIDFYLGGNIIDYVYDSNRPYILSFDLGSANSSFLIWQEAYIDNVKRCIIVGEYHPTKADDGSVKRMLEKIQLDFGTPQRAIAGNDINTRASTDNLTSMYHIRKIFGGGVPISSPQEAARNKEIQYDCTNALICNGANERKLLVSKNIKSLDPDKRGIMQLFKLDAFPEVQKNNDFFPKGNKYPLEHVRDALMYGVVCYFNIPQFRKTNYLNK